MLPHVELATGAVMYDDEILLFTYFLPHPTYTALGEVGLINHKKELFFLAVSLGTSLIVWSAWNLLIESLDVHEKIC